MQIQNLQHQAAAFAAALTLLICSGWANADPPARIARLGYVGGPVSFSPAGENDWVEATVNRPLTNGDRLWTDAGARAEIQIGGAMIRMGANTSVSILNLNDRIAQLRMTQGTLSVRVRRVAPNQVIEVGTPNLALTLRQSGEYRIEVDPDGNATDVIVRQGRAQVHGEGAAYTIDARQPYRFSGTGLREYQVVDPPRLDAFDRWASARDRGYEKSASARYVSQDVVGYQDLDAHGNWRKHPTYGNVWVPKRVAPGWTPYRDGHWAWVDPWGWTWIDDAPWGFAVSHYGRWANLAGTWAWVPAPVRSTAYYAPALVAFVGGSNFQVPVSGGNVGGVAWFPLAPREEYRPSYAVSRGYYENINRGNGLAARNPSGSNTVVNNTVVNYSTTNITNVIYANQQVPGAVIAVPTTTFVQAQPVSRAAVRVSQQALASAAVAAVAAVVPTDKSVRGAAAANDKPPAPVFQRSVVVVTAPPPASTGLAAQLPQLLASLGKPLDDAARKNVKPAAAEKAPVVKMAAPLAVAPVTTAASAPASADAKKSAPAPAVVVAPPIPPATSTAPIAKAQPLPRQAELPASAAQSAVPPAPAASPPRATTAQAAASAAAPQAPPQVAATAAARQAPQVAASAAAPQPAPQAAAPPTQPVPRQGGSAAGPARAATAAVAGTPTQAASAPGAPAAPRTAAASSAPAAPGVPPVRVTPAATASAPNPAAQASSPAPVSITPRASDPRPTAPQIVAPLPLPQAPTPRAAQTTPLPSASAPTTSAMPAPADRPASAAAPPAAAPPAAVAAKPPAPAVAPAAVTPPPSPPPARATASAPVAPAAAAPARAIAPASAPSSAAARVPLAKADSPASASQKPMPRASSPVGKKDSDQMKSEEESRKPKG